MQKWPVVKEWDIKSIQEFKYLYAGIENKIAKKY